MKKFRILKMNDWTKEKDDETSLKRVNYQGVEMNFVQMKQETPKMRKEYSLPFDRVLVIEEWEE